MSDAKGRRARRSVEECGLNRIEFCTLTGVEAVKSKGIRWVRYDERTRTLDVAYTSSGEYRYFDVGPEVYTWLMKAESKGKFVNRLVKDKYRYECVAVESALTDEGELEQLLRGSLRSPKNENE